MTLSIPDVDSLYIHTDEWSEITKKLLTQNRINRIKYLYLHNNDKYTEIGEWMDAFIESAQKTTKTMKLFYWRMDSNSLSKLFSALNRQNVITVELSKHSLMIIAFIFESSQK